MPSKSNTSKVNASIKPRVGLSRPSIPSNEPPILPAILFFNHFAFSSVVVAVFSFFATITLSNVDDPWYLLYKESILSCSNLALAAASASAISFSSADCDDPSEDSEAVVDASFVVVVTAASVWSATTSVFTSSAGAFSASHALVLAEISLLVSPVATKLFMYSILVI